MSEQIASCPACERPIPSDHPYAWCTACGTPLPESIRSELFALRRVQRDAAEAAARRSVAAEAVPLEVEGRSVSCPICGHGDYWTRETLMPDRLAGILDAEWASRSARNYVCNRCGYVLWFMRR